MSGGVAQVDTSHIKSPRDPMTPEEREAVWAELWEANRALWSNVAEHGDVREELHGMFGDPWTGERRGRTDAA